jgi:hypothetical protein
MENQGENEKEPLEMLKRSEVLEEISKLESTINEQVSASYESVKKYIGFIDFIAKPAYDQLVKFYTSAVENLKKLEELARDSEVNPEIFKTLQSICYYLKKEKSLIPRSFGGILGQTDKVYIIHAQLMKLNVGKHIQMDQFPHNSTAIFTVVNLLVLILGAEVMSSLSETSDGLGAMGGNTAESGFSTSGYFEDNIARGTADLGGLGDINIHQNPIY